MQSAPSFRKINMHGDDGMTRKTHARALAGLIVGRFKPFSKASMHTRAHTHGVRASTEVNCCSPRGPSCEGVSQP